MKDEDKQTLIELVTPQLAALNPGELVECQQLFDASYWGSVGKGVRRKFGLHIAQLVEQKVLPLERCKDLSCKRHNQYRRI